ncbi:MAG: phosphoenolpyruvate carboxykinase [Chloroflexi bacterium]|nr:phosphoenolpyruvate carboxykinase [Chloroflexota bacterium]
MVQLEARTYTIDAASLIANPPQEELQRLTAAMPNARPTEFGNLNVQTRVDARSAGSTYIVSDDPGISSGQTITRAEARRIADLQDAYIAERDMVVIDGWIGDDPAFRVGARLVIEKANANIAGMQRFLYFTDDLPAEPAVTIIYTPNLTAPGYPNDRLIAVDLEAGITRVFNSDYFGESKKGGLRMWNTIVYNRGGLALHAGWKVIPVNGRDRSVLIVGLSGTGKTTTTFTRQNGSLPVQDDFVALMPDGRVYATENGCFAKTFALDPKFEPNIYRGVTNPNAYLENASQDADGRIDFFDTSYTQNGRAVFPMSNIEWRHPAGAPPAELFLILNRNDNIIPGVARLTREQAAAYFMLGETMGTSAGGKDEMGKALRVPGTNPFWPLLHAQQGNRFHDILAEHPMEVFLLNTGWVGGPDGHPDSKKVKIPHSSAIVKAIAEETIEWTTDPDFGYEVATGLPDLEDIEILQPRRLYERTGRMDEYSTIVNRFKRERVEALAKYPTLRPEIAAAVR